MRIPQRTGTFVMFVGLAIIWFTVAITMFHLNETAPNLWFLGTMVLGVTFAMAMTAGRGSSEDTHRPESYFEKLYRTGKLWEEMKKIEDDKRKDTA